METIAIVRVRTDGGTQPRVDTNKATIAEYAEEMKRGEKFPPIKVVNDGTNYWLWDGFHRLAAAIENGNSLIAADVTQGTQRDAILLSLKANCDHGQRRTNEDKRRAVMVCLNDDEWKTKSSGWIADKCSVDQTFVLKIQKETGQVKPNLERKVVGKDGKTYTIKPKAEKPKEPQDGKATKEVAATATTAGSVAEPEESETQPARTSSNPIKDKHGNQIPKALQPIFSSTLWEEAKSLSARLTVILNQLRDDPAGHYLRRDMSQCSKGGMRLDSHERTLYSIKSCCPEGVCPECGGKGCGHCDQCGWLHRLNYKMVEGVSKF